MSKRLPDKLGAAPVAATVYHQPIRPLKPYWKRTRSGPPPMAPEDKLETLSIRVTAAQRATVHHIGLAAIRAWLDEQGAGIEPEINPPTEEELRRHGKAVRKQARRAELMRPKPAKL